MSAAMYVLAGTTCTQWTKKAFGKPGNEWDKEPGECVYSADKSKFEADDSKSFRKIYGVETLDVRKGNALLSRQMEGNKAERFPSLEAALAKQKAQIDALQALTKTPADLPFKAWASSRSLRRTRRKAGSGPRR